MEICFATNNAHKLGEVRNLLSNTVKILSLDDIGCNEEIPENQPTIEGNSLEKASYVYETYGISCFADDTGLEVFALNGEPGVYSARYAGPGKNSKDNISLLLKNLKDKTDRTARFKTVITAIVSGITRQFEGIVKGKIVNELKGSGGFGYDPVFVPLGYDISFAEMTLEEKNKISHRGIATRKLVDFLKNIR